MQGVTEVKMDQWPFGIGETRFITIVLHGSQAPKQAQIVTFDIHGGRESHGPCIAALDSGGKLLGDVIDEDSVLRLRHTLEAPRPYFAEVAAYRPDAAVLSVRVSWPTRVVAATGPIRVVLPATIRKSIEGRFLRGAQEVDLDSRLQGLFVYRRNYLVWVPDGKDGSTLTLLSPKFQLPCKVCDKAFLVVRSSETRVERAEESFRQAGLLHGNVEWLSCEAEDLQVADRPLQLLEVVKSDGSYFDIWETYRQLQERMLSETVAELPELSYDRWQSRDEVVRFYLNKEHDASAWRDLSVNVSVDLVVPPRRARRDADGREDKGLVVPLGSIRRVEPDFIEIDRPDDTLEIPPRAKLQASVRGQEVQLARQKAALERLLSGASPLPNLARVLATGQTDSISSFPIRPFLGPRLMANAKPPDDRQEAALVRALNTDDICLVQGPPGTGKTTFIRTLVRRLKEEGRRHLLIASYQHLAVDNALEGLHRCGVISYRFGGDRDETTYFGDEVTQWIHQVSDKAKAYAASLSGDDSSYGRSRELLRIVEAASGVQSDLVTCCGVLKTVQQDFPGALSSGLREQAVILSGELQERQTLRDIQASDPVHTERLQQLIDAVPSPGDIRSLQAAHRELEVEVKRLRRARPDSRSLADAYIRQVELLHRQALRVGFSRPQADAEARLQREAAVAKDMALQFLQHCQAHFADQGIGDDADASWRPAFDQWCRSTASHLRVQIGAGSVTSGSVVHEWLADLQNPERVLTLFRKHADVWGVTCQQSVARRFGLYDEEYDCVIIDEAARAGPLDLLIPLVHARRVVLVGDQMQLPHTLDYELQKQFEAAAEPEQRQILRQSLFARLFDSLPRSKKVRLNMQYRMHPNISRMVSRVFYKDDPLKDDPSTHDLVNDTGLFNGRNIVWLDARPDGRAPNRSLEEGRFLNRTEAEIILSYARQLLVKSAKHSIGIITFYAQQRDLIERRLQVIPGSQDVKPRTVDAFQGKQADVILLSMVRSNPGKELGFLNSPNRLNVALSRARRLLVIVGDGETLSANQHARDVFDYCKEQNSVISQVQ